MSTEKETKKEETKKRKPRRKPSREEYKSKFDKQFAEYCWIPQSEKGVQEQIVQCKPPYPPYWFVSNMGYLFTSYFKKLRIVKPLHRKTGEKNKEGKRTGQDWYYWNSYGDQKQKKVTMHKLIAEHFCENPYTDEEVELHHIQKKSSFTPDQADLCNRATNLQYLPKDVHKRATAYARMSEEEIDKKMWDKVIRSGAPINVLPNDVLEDFILAGIKNTLRNGNRIDIVLPNSETGEVEVKSIFDENEVEKI